MFDRDFVQIAAISVAASGDNTIIAAVAGKLITVVGLLLVNSVATAQSVILKDGATALSGAMQLGSSPLVLPDNGSNGFDWFRTSSTANNLVLNLSAATAVGGTIWYIQQ